MSRSRFSPSDVASATDFEDNSSAEGSISDENQVAQQDEVAGRPEDRPPMTQDEVSEFLGITVADPAIAISTGYAIKNRRDSTSVRYEQHIRDFIAFCRTKGLGCDVTGDKLLRFINEEIMVRPRRLGWRSRYSVTTAICFLYSKQRLARVNPYTESPRNDAVKARLDFLKSQDMTAANGIARRDPQRGTEADGYNSAEKLLELLNILLLRGTLDAMMLRLAAMLSHFGILRCNELLGLQLQDCLLLSFNEADPIQPGVQVLAFNIRNSKMNADGRKEYAPMMRNKNLLLCPVFAFALSLFVRFQLLGEPFPQIHQTEDWYHRYVVINHAEPAAPLKSDRYGRLVKALFPEWRVVTSKCTHIFRQGGARHLDNMQVPKTEVAKHGRWTQDVLTSTYLDSISSTTVKAHAGFRVQERYLVSRLDVTPPQEVLDMIFPELIEAEVRLTIAEAADPDARLVTTNSFLKLLTYFKTVLAQDLALLKHYWDNSQEMRPHPIFNHPMFESDIFRSWQETIVNAVGSLDNPAILFRAPLLEQAAPELMQAINDIKSQNVAIRNDIRELKRARNDDARVIASIFSDNLIRTGLQLRQATSEDSNSPSGESAPLDDPPIRSAPPATTSQLRPRASGAASAVYNWVNGKRLIELNRDVQTVVSLYNEWTRGVENRLPIQRQYESSEFTLGSSSGERKFFFRRKKIIEFIEQLVPSHASDSQHAALLVEQW